MCTVRDGFSFDFASRNSVVHDSRVAGRRGLPLRSIYVMIAERASQRVGETRA